MIDPNALSLVAQGLRDSLAQGLDLDSSQILIGNPAVGASTAENQTGLQFLNLFFFRVDYGGFPASATSDEPIYLRMFCLMTAFGNDETDGDNTVTAGENDLRLVGGVMAHMHQSPIIRIRDELDREVAQIQVLVTPMTNDDLNNIWSTQTDTSYRLSVAYEIALIPAPLERPRAGALRVGSVGLGLFSGEDMGAEQQRPMPLGGFDTGISGPTPPAHGVRTHTADGTLIEAWTPFLYMADGNLHLALSLAYRSDALPANMLLLALGLQGASCELVIQQWDTTEGWLTLTLNPVPSVTISARSVDPRCFNPDLIQTGLDFPLSEVGQYQLFLQRSYTNALGVEVTVRSNPVLITIASAEDSDD